MRATGNFAADEDCRREAVGSKPETNSLPTAYSLPPTALLPYGTLGVNGKASRVGPTTKDCMRAGGLA